MAKVMISLPEGLLSEVDKAAESEHRTRSDLVREALREYLRTVKNLLLAEDAFRFARKHDITFYDASFVALSYLLQAFFITADKKLFAKVRTLPTAMFLGKLS